MSLPPIVVFDLDGTLAETAPDIMRDAQRHPGAEGLAALPLERARELVGAGARALIERGFKRLGPAARRRRRWSGCSRISC